MSCLGMARTLVGNINRNLSNAEPQKLGQGGPYDTNRGWDPPPSALAALRNWMRHTPCRARGGMPGLQRNAADGQNTAPPLAATTNVEGGAMHDQSGGQQPRRRQGAARWAMPTISRRACVSLIA